MRPHLLQILPMNAPALEAGLQASYQVHRLDQAADPAALLAEVAPHARARGIAVTITPDVLTEDSERWLPLQAEVSVVPVGMV